MPFVRWSKLMTKINVYLSDDLADAVKEAAVPVSAVCQAALRQAVRRITATREVTARASEGAAIADPPAVNFTARARSALEAARGRAGAEGAAATGTGHLLRELVETGLGADVLAAMEITRDQVRSALDQRTAADPSADAGQELSAGGGHQPSAGGGQASALALSNELATTIELSCNESSGLGNSYIGTEHLLLGLIAEPRGAAGSVLRSLGADLRVTRRTVAAALAGWSARASARQDRADDQLHAAIRAEVAPLVARLERLEGRVAS
jgi:ATP-dependent Clp protease ATP-binding subunit ClpA/post-segregation antitoxin (ccd killing protein)